MNRLYARVSDDEYRDYKVAIASAGLTVEVAIRKGLNLLLFNHNQTQGVYHVRESDHRSQEDQKGGQGN